MQARPYQSGEIQVKDDLVVTINAAQSGIVYADISTLLDPLGWAVFSQVVIKTQYEDKEHSVPLKQYTQVVSDKTHRCRLFIRSAPTWTSRSITQPTTMRWTATA